MKLEREATRPRRVDPGAWAMAGILAAMWAVLAITPATRGVFLTEGNLATLLTQSSVLLVIAVGMTLVVMIRGIDLSVGAGVALTGVVAALAQIQLGLSAPIAVALAVGCGALLGAWHGLWVGRLGVPAFVVTLAGFKAYRGGALVLSDAKGLAPMHDDFAVLAGTVPATATWAIVVAALAAGVAVTVRDAMRRRALGLRPTTTATIALRIGGYTTLAGLVLAVFGSRGVPVSVLVAGGIALAGVFVTRRTRFGRHLYAIGGNPEAARLSGIDVRRTTFAVYVIAGVLTGIAGVLLAARVDGVTPGSQGQLLELDAVTAVVIGGTSLSGGKGSIAGTVLGTLVFATLANGMNLLHVDSNWQLVCTGLILLAAVGIDVMSKHRHGAWVRIAIIGVLGALAIGALAMSSHERPRVAFLLSTLQEERYHKDVRYFTERTRAHDLATVVLAADNDNAKQIAQVEDVLAQGAEVLVIQPTDSQAASTYVRLAHERGAKVIAYDRTITSPELDYYVSHDSYKVGVLQAKAAIAATGGTGRYVLLSGQAGHSVATEITRGYDDTLAPYIASGAIEIVLRQNHSAWAPEQALRTVEDALTRTGGKLDAILANNSGMARGAVQALKQRGLDHVFVAGADADAANVNFVCEGRQSIEVLKDIQPLAETAADVAAGFLSGSPPKPSSKITIAGAQVPVAAVRVEVVTPENVKSLLIDSGFATAAELSACAVGGSK